MKGTVLVVWLGNIVLLISILGFICRPAAYANDVIRLATGDYPPFMAEEMKYKGVASCIVTKALNLAGYEVDIRILPWKRAYALSVEGKAFDGTFVWLKTAERERLFYYSDPVIAERQVFFHLKGRSFDWDSVQDLAGLRIGALLGFTYGAAFRDGEKASLFSVDRSDSDVENFNKLLEGRIDLYPQLVEVGYYQIFKNFPPEVGTLITNHPKPVLVEHSYLLLSRKDPQNETVMARFNDALRQLRKNGRIDQCYMDLYQRN